jgi:hypothetical protein
MRGTLVYKKHTLAKSSLESIWKFIFRVHLVVSIFNMHARRPIRPHMAIKPKFEVSAGGRATITSLPIISSRELYDTRLTTKERG